MQLYTIIAYLTNKCFYLQVSENSRNFANLNQKL